MKFILTVLGLWHEWRAAVWRARSANPPLDENKHSRGAWERWDRACEVMEMYHQRRYDMIGKYLKPRISLRYFDPKDLP